MHSIVTTNSILVTANDTPATGTIRITPCVGFEYVEGGEKRFVTKDTITAVFVNGKLTDTLSLSPTSGSGHDTVNLYYTAVFKAGKLSWTQYWVIPATETATIEIVDIAQIAKPSTPANVVISAANQVRLYDTTLASASGSPTTFLTLVEYIPLSVVIKQDGIALSRTLGDFTEDAFPRQVTLAASAAPGVLLTADFDRLNP